MSIEHIKSMKKNIKFFIGGVLVILLVFFIASLFLKKEIRQGSSKDQTILLSEEVTKDTKFFKKQQYCDFFPKRRRENYNLQLNEKAGIAVFFDKKGEKNILYQKNIKEKLPIASLTKLMTAIIVFDNYDLDKVVEISKSAVDTPEEVGRLIVGEKISIWGLLNLALLVSSNDAAQALAEVIGPEKFVEMMNKKTQEIGLFNTHFSDAHGLSNGNYSTAEDLVLLTQYSIIHYPQIWKILRERQMTIIGTDSLGREIVHSPNNTNKLLGEDYVFGGKTGYTNEAGDTMILAMNSPGIVEGDIVLVLLGLGVAERIPRTKNFYDWVRWGWNWGELNNK